MKAKDLLIILTFGLGLGLTLLALNPPHVTMAQGAANCYATPDDGINVYGTVQEAVDAARPGATVKIAGTCADVNKRDGLIQTVYVSKPLTIRGGYPPKVWTVSDPDANPTMLDAQGLGRVMFITGTVGVTLENLIVTHGIVTGNSLCPIGCGGGIMANGELTLINITVIDNSAERAGGGVANLLTTTVTSSRFEGNSVTGNGDGGGGLHAEGPVSIQGTAFVRNTSTTAGGGINVQDSAVSIANSSFVQNQSFFSWGGAVRASFPTVSSGPVSITGTTFVSNSVGVSSTIQSANGGAVASFNAHVTVTNSRFENNRCVEARCAGGGLYVLGNTFFVTPVVTLSNTTFISNLAAANGGGAFVTGLTVLTNGYFARNHAGGGTHAFSEGGGGLWTDGLVLEATRFISNTSGEDGGGLLVQANRFASGAVLTDAYFANNVAASSGGGFAYNGTTLSAVPLIRNAEFISNTAGLNGGGLWSRLAGALLEGSRFERNRADGPENDGGLHRTENGGGGAWINDTLTLTNTDFISNVAQTNGGGAHVRGDAILGSAQFNQNRSLGDFSLFSYGGGGIYVVGSLTFTETSFNDNQGFMGGGAWSGGPVTGTGGLFQANYSGFNGGGLVAQDTMALAGTQFISNTAQHAGGGAVAFDAARLTDVLFRSNHVISTTSPGSGGGLYASGDLLATRTRFISNSVAGSGGGASASGSVNLADSLFQGNVGNGGGGGGLIAFLSFDATFVATNTRFISNTATGSGGGLSGSFQPLQLTNSLFQNNWSDGGTGGGASTSGRVLLTGTQFISNAAQLDGGGVFANSGVAATGSRFERNRSLTGDGGGASAPGGDIVFEDVTLVANGASGDGGGAQSFRATIDGGFFAENTAQRDGGGLWVRRQTMVTGTAFVGNEGGGLGGGVVISGAFESLSRLTNNLFVRNTAPVGNALSVNIPDNPNSPDGEVGTVNVLHNTIVSLPGINGSAIQVITGNVHISNTIITSHAIGIDNLGGVVTEAHNLFSGNGVNAQGAVSGGADSLVGDPAFASPAEDDYHLTIRSPAIDQGTELGVTQDLEGDPRPQGAAPDIGYDESPFTAQVDLVISKTVSTDAAAPGDTITYTLRFSHTGAGIIARGVIVTDSVPPQLTNLSVASRGATITPTTGISLAWTAQDLAPGEGGVITIVGELIAPLARGLTFTSTAEITTTASDGDGANNSAKVAVTVNNVAPRAADDRAETDEEIALVVPVLDNDSDLNGDGLSIVSAGVAANGTVGTGGPTVIYTPNLNFNGTDVFTYTISDGGLIATANVTVTVIPVNDPPEATDDAQVTPENIPVTIDVLANDDDPDAHDSLTIGWVGTPMMGSTTTDGVTVTYTPTLRFHGIDVFTYTVSDGELTGTAAVSITVTPVNDAPDAYDDTTTTDEDTRVTIDPLNNDSDLDGDALAVVSVGAPANGSVGTDGAIVTYTPTLNFNGIDVFTYTVSDGELTDTGLITAMVNAVNDPPFIFDIPDQSTQADMPIGPIAFTIGDVDAPADDLTVSSASSNIALVPHSSVDLGGSGVSRTVTITPATGLSGMTVITISVSDGIATTSDSFVVTVAASQLFMNQLYLPIIFNELSFDEWCLIYCK